MSLCLIICTLLNIATLVRNSRSKIPARQYCLETNSLFCFEGAAYRPISWNSQIFTSCVA